jgi:hypothetical protein
MYMIYLRFPLSPAFARGLLRVACFALILLTTACAALDSLFATPTPSIPTATPQPTATPVWFPPTITPSPEYLLTRAPTPEMHPGVGDIILTDDFSDPDLWDIAASDQASANLVGSRLNLSVQSGVYMISLRHAITLGDHYAEITAQPSLCRNEDSYGVLIRANAVSYYRFSLSCNGMVSAERLSGKAREILQKPLASGDTPFGAGEVRIGVWALGADIRLFLNDRYQFEINNTSYPVGTIGVFANSAGDTPTVISFSDLVVKEVK